MFKKISFLGLSAVLFASTSALGAVPGWNCTGDGVVWNETMDPTNTQIELVEMDLWHNNDDNPAMSASFFGTEIEKTQIPLPEDPINYNSEMYHGDNGINHFYLTITSTYEVDGSATGTGSFIFATSDDVILMQDIPVTCTK